VKGATHVSTPSATFPAPPTGPLTGPLRDTLKVPCPVPERPGNPPVEGRPRAPVRPNQLGQADIKRLRSHSPLECWAPDVTPYPRVRLADYGCRVTSGARAPPDCARWQCQGRLLRWAFRPRPYGVLDIGFLTRLPRRPFGKTQVGCSATYAISALLTSIERLYFRSQSFSIACPGLTAIGLPGRLPATSLALNLTVFTALVAPACNPAATVRTKIPGMKRI
jgi:hypothetical protein